MDGSQWKHSRHAGELQAPLPGKRVSVEYSALLGIKELSNNKLAPLNFYSRSLLLPSV